jgi:AbrB family looped-hinge helix DNA binding protein
MKTTIDKAGRVVIPADIRKKAGLTAGTELDVIVDDLSVRLIRSAPAAAIKKRGKRLVVKPAAASKAPAVDVQRLIEEERNRWPW